MSVYYIPDAFLSSFDYQSHFVVGFLISNCHPFSPLAFSLYLSTSSLSVWALLSSNEVYFAQSYSEYKWSHHRRWFRKWSKVAVLSFPLIFSFLIIIDPFVSCNYFQLPFLPLFYSLNLLAMRKNRQYT